MRVALEKQPQQEETCYIENFSNLTRLIRVTAQCFQFIENCRLSKSGQPPRATFLSTSELTRARIGILKLVQNFAFNAELAVMRGGRPLTPRNHLARLNPFLEDDGILRVGGRLNHSSLTFKRKHPPILPKRLHLSALFVQHMHGVALHGRPSLTLSIVRNHVWVIGAPGLVKQYVRNCVKCRRTRPRLATQLMGALPTSRVTPPERAFTITGLDYAGPIKLRAAKGRGHISYKGYIALFVCFSSKAIHLEAVSDLSTAGFLAAYRRFVGRRGICRTIYSDHGTNFQGAAKELARMFKAASDFYGEVSTTLANEGTAWSFIPPPPYAPLWRPVGSGGEVHQESLTTGHRRSYSHL